MRDACSFEPLIAIDLVIADYPANALVEDFRAAARQRIDSGSFQSLQRFADSQFRTPCQERNFNHRERFQVYLRKTLFQSRNEIEEVLERQVRMESTDEVKLRHCFRIS